MRLQARPVLAVVFVLLAALTPKSLLADVGRWTSSGPDGGAVRALASVASVPSTVYLATGRRVYKSVDAGAHWAPTGLAGSFGVLLTASTPSVVYAIDGQRFRRTTDGGETWVTRPGPLGILLSATVDGRDPLTLSAAGLVALFRTTDGGDSWQQVASLPSGGFLFTAFAVSPNDSALVYAGVQVSNGGAVYVSSNGGRNWTRTNLQETTRALHFDPRDASRVFALTDAGIRLTTNRGQSWRPLAPGVSSPSQLVLDPTDSSRLYVLADGAVFYSSDGGETVTPVASGNVGVGVRAIAALESSVVLAGSSRGLYRSQDGGRVWSASHSGIRELAVLSLAVDPTDPSIVFAGSSLGIHKSHDGGGIWNGPLPGSPAEMSVIAVDPTTPSTLYVAGRGVHKSTDGGRTWEDRSPEAIANYIAALVIDPNDARRVFASYEEVLRSLDRAENWEVVSRLEDNVASFYYPPTANAMAIAPSDSAIVYAGGASNDYYSGFVSRSEDRGTVWSAPATLSSPVRTLAVDPCDPRIVYAGTYSGVYRSTDAGATWSEPALTAFVYTLALDPRQSSSVFAGTREGLFWTNDSGASWTRFEPFLQMPVHSVAIDSSGRFLHAATNEGVFSLERSFEPCVAGGKQLCLLGSRFELTVTARDTRSGVITSIDGQGVPDGDRFGYFSFPALTGDARFPEVFVKMADAAGLPAPYGNNVWVFHTSLTDLDYTLTVRDTLTGRVRIYNSEKLGSPPAMACGVADTRAFDGACRVRTLSAPLADSESSVASAPTLSLLGGRFRATLRATDPRTSRTVEGEAVPRADGFGYFSLPGFTGDASFPEVFVKMTDGTAAPGGSYWVFHSGLTDVDYTLTVTDQSTGAVRSYRRGAPAGAELCGQADTSAFRN